MADPHSPTKPKKSRLKRKHCQIDQVLITRTTKCSLTSVLPQQHSEFSNLLENTVLLINQLETLGCWIVKHHLFTTLQNQGAISFEINQTYLWKAFRQILEPIKDRTHLDYVLSLNESVQFVKKTVQPSLAQPMLCLTAVNQLLSYSARTVLTNFRVHVQTHLQTAFDCWIKNQICAIMTEEEYENQSQHFKSYKDSLPKMPFFAKYEVYKTQIDAVLKIIEETTPPSEQEADQVTNKIPYNLCFQWMWEMRRDSERLELHTNRPMKGISVFPQCSMTMGHIHIDTVILCHIFRKLFPKDKTSIAKLKELENQEKVWGTVLDLQKIRRLRPGWQFGWSVKTNGITASVTFVKGVPKSNLPAPKRQKKQLGAPRSKKPRISTKSSEQEKSVLTNLPIGFHYEKSILEQYRQWESNVQWISVDPGVRNVLTCWAVGQNKSPFKLGQRQYRHESGLDTALQKSNCIRKQYAETVQPHFDAVPYIKSVNLDHIKSYLQVLGQFWLCVWQFESGKKLRRIGFTRWIRQQEFIDKTLAKLDQVCQTDLTKKTIVLFGMGGSSGFGHVRGGGVKGPVVKLRRLLSKRQPVIGVDEFRTSKCCLQCGKVLKHPRKGKMTAVSYCSETDHHCFMDRDVDAARKIGYRFLCQLQHGKNDVTTLGSWSREYEKKDLEKGLGCSPLYPFLINKFPRDRLPATLGRSFRPLGTIQHDIAFS